MMNQRPWRSQGVMRGITWTVFGRDFRFINDLAKLRALYAATSSRQAKKSPPSKFKYPSNFLRERPINPIETRFPAICRRDPFLRSGAPREAR